MAIASMPLGRPCEPGAAPSSGRSSSSGLLGLGAFGLAWSITTVAAYLPPLLEEFTSSSTL